MQTTDKPLAVEVWSDIACPWCWVGKRNLEAALAQYDGEAQVRWRAFELNPSAPKSIDGDIDYVQKLATKYRVSRDGAQQMIDRMIETGAAVGLEFRFDRVRPVNTFDGHRLIAMAARDADLDVHGAVSEALFAAYMNQGRDVADRDTLVEIATSCGLDADAAIAMLESDELTEEVRADQARSRSMGVTGVPFTVVGGVFGIPGAQPVRTLVNALGVAAAKVAELDDGVAFGEGAACDTDGCA